MSRESRIPPDFAEWIVRSLDGTITPEQFTQLDQEITANEQARIYYLEFITTYVGLMALMGGLPRAETLVGADAAPVTDETEARHRTAPGVVEYPAPGKSRRKDASDLRVGPETSEQDRIREIERLANRQLAEFLAREQQERREPQIATAGWDFRAGIDAVGQAAQRFVAVGARLARTAAVCLLVLSILAIVGLYIYANRTLGALVDSANAVWSTAIGPEGILRAGPITLEEGYARIRLGKGAEVILQAPTTFDLRTTNRMFLDGGWITAKVPPSATGFTIRTPTSSVVDFGTEFGLLAGDAGNTEIHVFDGEIEFGHAGGGPAGRSQRLVKNEAMTIGAGGYTRRIPLQQRPHLFVRTMPTGEGFAVPGRRLSLADMVGAGNGLDTGVWGQGIDASTGQITSRRTILKKNDNGFVPVPSLPFIDGVFVPDSSDGSAIVTSTGISFERCPGTSGTSYEAIVNGATFQVGSSGEVHYGRLAGRTYDARANPSIGMHPNAGITFDLDALRNAMPEARIERFRARCGVSENVVRFAERDADPNAIAVTFWVLVDGRPRFSQTLGVVPAQSEPIDVPLDPRDRFLTLATTNPGEYRYCWALFAEPALELTREKEVAALEHIR